MKQHALPGYARISEQLEHASHVGLNFSAAYCQMLLETADSYAEESQALPGTQAVCLEMIGYLNTLPSRNKAEREARTALLERAERILKYDQNNARTTEPSESVG